MLYAITRLFVTSAEKRLGAALDYVHHIAKTKTTLLLRYNKIFGFLDPNRNVPALAYHAARIRGAVAADCGTCVEVELNLAKNSKIEPETIKRVLTGDYESFDAELRAVCELADSVVGSRLDHPDARATLAMAYGDAGLIELCFAMNGAALLPGIKRGMGYATACNIDLMRGKL